MNYQGIFVTAWVGIAVVHICSGAYKKLFGETVYYHIAEVPNFNPAGLTAWFVAAGTGLVLTVTDVLGAYAPLITFGLSVAIYSAFLRNPKPNWYHTPEADPAERMNLSQ